MTALANTVVGLAFVGLAAALTFLMFYIWKFPFDHERLASSAPRRLIRLHRLLGLVYVLIYLYLMWQMVPRLWTYQIELPARTVLHLGLGLLIGAILLTKLSIVRFFRHLEAKLVPGLGVALFICSFLLIALTLPFSLREAYLQRAALGAADMSDARIARVRELLPAVGLTDAGLLEQLASRQGLDAGRRAMQTKCVQCHDLRTVLARPRTPASWKQTVERMANRATILAPISEAEQWQVTAYLIAVSPTLQQSLKLRREAAMETMASRDAMQSAARMAAAPAGADAFDLTAAKAVFERTCSLCHAHTQVANAPPATRGEAVALVERMVGNGLVANDRDLNTVIRYLTATYAGEAADGAEAGNAAAQAAGADPPAAENAEAETAGADPPAAGNAAALPGALLYAEKGCAACHGADGRSPLVAGYPKLAGLSRAYLRRQFTDIRDGARANGLSGVMAAAVRGVADDEMAAIAEWLAEH